MLISTPLGQHKALSESTLRHGPGGRYQLSSSERGLLLIGGIGIGAGGFAAEGESLLSSETSSGGSIWNFSAMNWEVKRAQVLPISELFQGLGPQMESEVVINLSRDRSPLCIGTRD